MALRTLHYCSPLTAPESRRVASFESHTPWWRIDSLYAHLSDEPPTARTATPLEAFRSSQRSRGAARDEGAGLYSACGQAAREHPLNLPVQMSDLFSVAAGRTDATDELRRMKKG